MKFFMEVSLDTFIEETLEAKRFLCSDEKTYTSLKNIEIQKCYTTNTYLFQVNNRGVRKRCEICSS